MNYRHIFPFAFQGIIAAILLFGCANSASQTQPTTIPSTPIAESSSGQPGMGDPYYEQLGNGGYDVTDYTIVLTIDPTTNAISGSTKINAKASQPLNAFNLDLQGLTVDQVQVNTKPATFSLQDHEMTIVPEQPLIEGDAFSIIVYYHGSPQPVKNVASTFFSTVGWFHSASGAINVISEPNGTASWFPVNDHPRDKATYRFEITVPKPWVVAATGKLLDTIEGGSQTLYIWEMGKPMASYLASISIDKYVIETKRGPEGVTIRNYLTSDLSEESKKNIDLIPNMMEYFDGLFGAYPFDEYGIVVADKGITPCQRFDSAEENQTLSMHCPKSLDENTIAHELAHQWFGDDVSLENWQDIWLKEGMATYAEWLWQNREKNLDGLTKFVNEQSFPQDSKIGQPPASDIYDYEIYIGGAKVFHALRLQVGDEAFFKILRSYLERYRYGNAGTDEFIAVAEEISGKELSSFFDSWLMQEKIPEMPR